MEWDSRTCTLHLSQDSHHHVLSRVHCALLMWNIMCRQWESSCFSQLCSISGSVELNMTPPSSIMRVTNFSRCGTKISWFLFLLTFIHSSVGWNQLFSLHQSCGLDALLSSMLGWTPPMMGGVLRCCSWPAGPGTPVSHQTLSPHQYLRASDSAVLSLEVPILLGHFSMLLKGQPGGSVVS